MTIVRGAARVLANHSCSTALSSAAHTRVPRAVFCIPLVCMLVYATWRAARCSECPRRMPHTTTCRVPRRTARVQTFQVAASPHAWFALTAHRTGWSACMRTSCTTRPRRLAAQAVVARRRCPRAARPRSNSDRAVERATGSIVQKRTTARATRSLNVLNALCSVPRGLA